jgi:hypothetical protein
MWFMGDYRFMVLLPYVVKRSSRCTVYREDGLRKSDAVKFNSQPKAYFRTE